MKLRLKTIKRLLRIHRIKPHIVITEYGQLTKAPYVSVGIHSGVGMLGLRAWAADDAGHAQATVLAKSLAHNTGFPVIDNRAKPEIPNG